MRKLNVEFKARVADLNPIRERLLSLNPRELGLDFQRDTYFAVPEGRLKLREGRIENTLIFYRRSDSPSTRESQVELTPISNPSEVRKVLAAALPVRAVVEKQREIYYVRETKIHLDRVEPLGCFVEVEAPTAADASYFFRFFGLEPGDLEGKSYSDLV